MPALDPGPSLPKPYLRLSRRDDRQAPASLVNDPDVERVSKLAATTSIASTLPAAPELSKKTGQPLTKAEKKALKDATAGPGWFDLPAPPASELPRLAREVEALRLRNSLDPKRFYRKEDTRAGPLPKHFALGHIVAEGGAFEGGGGGRGRDDLPRAARKRTIVDELMADDEARTYAKRKFAELQSVRDERGRGTYRRKFAKRQKKF
ncbi:Fcf2-domain-containing protein [Clavulina sp. PMI_390]|nr:Fcf2-domain-containing protein [Clavulina sp. PMI_390]